MKMRKIPHKKILILILIIIILIPFCLYQNKHLVITTYTYESEKLGADLDGYRIVQISDLHNAEFGKENKKLLETIRSCSPDIIIITGDLVDSNHTNVERAVAFVKEAVKIPVIGNGDVTSGQKALDMFEQTGCDGVMIGRGCQGNPWIFRELLAYEETGSIPERPGTDQIRETMLRHARLQIEFKGNYIGIREMRKHVAWYTKGMQGSAKLRDEINQVESYEELENLLMEKIG